MTRSARLSFVSALFFATILASCSAPRSGGMIADVESMADGEHIDKAAIDRQLVQTIAPSLIELGEIDISGVVDQRNFSKQEGLGALKTGILGTFHSRPAILSLAGSGPLLRLDLSIVEMSTGDAALRVLASGFGAGHAFVQVDGLVVDPETNVVLAQLSDRRRASGWGGTRDLLGSSGAVMVGEMLEEIGRSLLQELDLLFRVGAP